MTNKSPIKVFISYARKDESFKDELIKHLKPLVRDNTIQIWYDALITPGKNWDEEIKIHIQEAQIIILLISADFMASDYIYDVEISKSLDRSRKRENIIVPVIIRPTSYLSLEINKYQALPKDGKPISTWTDKDEAWMDVTRSLEKLFDSLSQGRINLEESKNFSISIINEDEDRNIKEQSIDSIAQIKNLIVKGNLDRALTLSLKILKEYQQDDSYNSILLLSSRYNSLKRNEHMGIISYSESQTSRNQITHSLLSILDEIEKYPV